MAVTTMKRKPILCLDFDGVIHSYTSGWKGAAIIPDSPVDGVFDFLYNAISYFDVQIFSSRSGQKGGIDAMKDWLFNHEATWLKKRSQSGLPQMRTCLALCVSFPNEKPPAMLTIDDRALTFTGNWADFDPKALLNFKPWNTADTSKGVG